MDRLAYEIFRRTLAGDATTEKVDLLEPEEFVKLVGLIVAGAANRQSVGGRPVREEFLAMLPMSHSSVTRSRNGRSLNTSQAGLRTKVQIPSLRQSTTSKS